MELVFVKVPKTASTFFEKNFDMKYGTIHGTHKRIRSVGHSWLYPTQIKGWRDWDFPEQPPAVYRDVDTFVLNNSDKIVTIVRNPFALLFSYFNYDWAWCRKYHGLPINSYTKNDFQKFVDIYLDDGIEFHAPAFKKSLFSQLKSKDGKWILNEDSIVLRFENLQQDINRFSELVNIPITDNTNSAKNTTSNQRPCNWYEAYRDDQVEKLTELWKEDLDYFGYDYTPKKFPSIVKKIKRKVPKIALCFSGLIRDVDTNKKFWNSFIKDNDVDVYGSFWDTETQNLNDTIINLKSSFNFKELEFEKFNSFKKSTLDVITPYIEPTERVYNNLREYAKNFHTLSMWYKVWRANMLSKNLDIDYDIVIRARLDTYFQDKLIVEKNDYLNIPSGRVVTNGFPNSMGINDIFGYAKPKIMDYYSSTYLNLLEYLNQGHYMIPPEHFLNVHLNKVDLNLRFFTNKLVITRTSKGINDEIYDKNEFVEEEVLPSTFMNISPNPEITWTKSIRDSLKF